MSGIVTRNKPGTRDRGTVLVLALVLTVVLSVVVLALTNVAATGLRTSGVTTSRTDARASVVAGVHYVADQLARGAAPCSVLEIPQGFVAGADAVTVECEQLPSLDTDSPTVRLTVSSSATRVTAFLQVQTQAVEVATGRHPVAVLQWTDSVEIN